MPRVNGSKGLQRIYRIQRMLNFNRVAFKTALHLYFYSGDVFP